MFWAILISIWGGFLMGVIFMAVLYMSRENRPLHAGQHRPETVPIKPAPLKTREPEVKVMHG